MRLSTIATTERSAEFKEPGALSASNVDRGAETTLRLYQVASVLYQKQRALLAQRVEPKLYVVRFAAPLMAVLGPVVNQEQDARGPI